MQLLAGHHYLKSLAHQDSLNQHLTCCLLPHVFFQLLHALSVCLHNGANVGRPGSETELKNDVLHFVTFCTGILQKNANTISPNDSSSTSIAVEPSSRSAASDCSRVDVDSGGGGGRSRGGAGSAAAAAAEARSSRTIVMRLLQDVIFFHLRSDAVAQQDKWHKMLNSLDHPSKMDWAKEGKVPMLNMTRGAFLEACERDHKLSALIVADVLRLEEEAQRERRAASSEHEAEQWLRLQVLRFLHVEQEDKKSCKINFEVMQVLSVTAYYSPSEACPCCLVFPFF